MSLQMPGVLRCVSLVGERLGVPLGLGALLLLVPLIPFNFIYIQETPFLFAACIRFFPFLLAFVVSVLGLIIVLNNQDILYEGISLPLFLIVLCIGAIFLSVFSSAEFIQSSMRAIYFVFSGEVLCVLAALTLRNRQTILWLLGVHILSTVIVSIYGLLEVGFGPFTLTESVFSADNYLLTRFGGGRAFEQIGRATSTIGNPNLLGAYLSFGSPFFLCFFLNWKTKLGKLGMGFCYILVTCLLYFTFSRGAWISFGVCNALFLWRHYRAFASVLVLLMIVMLGWATASHKIKNTYEELVVDFEHRHRPRSYAIATQIWVNQPLLGTGSGAYRFFCKPLGSQNDTPDNMYLLMLAENGVLGLSLRLSLFVSIISLLVRSNSYIKKQLKRSSTICGLDLAAHSNMIRAFIASQVGFLVNILSFDGLQFPVNRISFWLVTGLSLAYVRINCPEIWLQSFPQKWRDACR
jgi:hypothetical protein